MQKNPIFWIAIALVIGFIQVYLSFGLDTRGVKLGKVKTVIKLNLNIYQ
jgi:hypothetical protein